ncbi:DUF3014 domain-containing protein [uncultured Ferrimonas sp.]|uniref:DUF3014 domain-containing protein n=1 Tax=uncultured Ferrimonas sp. TaxID=432640 RepID=UPI0026099F73|nr:DUF3014 domain-containing protein [uncultured Ferrimonas sp.]
MYSDDNSTNSNISQIAVGFLLLTAIACGVGWYFLSGQDEPAPTPEPIAPVVIAEPTLPIEPLPVEPVIEPEPEPEPEPVAIVAPEPAVAAEPEPEPEPLPSLNESDPITLDAIDAVADGMQIGNALKQDNLLRRIAVFVDNLTAGEVMRAQGPLSRMTEPFPVLELSNGIYLDPEGYRRFDQLADFLYRLDETKLRDQFLLLEPLLEQAYQELGYPQGQFRSTLFSAMDQVLNAPELDQPLALTSPSVNYQFVDEDLEARSDAQKVMIRMGPTNTRKIKSLLSRFKGALNE